MTSERTRVVVYLLGIGLTIAAIILLWRKVAAGDLPLTGLILVVLGIGLLLMTVLMLSLDDEVGQGCAVGALATLCIVVALYLALYQPFPIPVGLSTYICPTWNQGDVDGTIFITPRSYSIGDRGTVNIELRNKGTGELTLRNGNVNLGGLRTGFLAEAGFVIDLTESASTISMKRNDISGHVLSVDETILRPNEILSIEIPIVAATVGEYPLSKRRLVRFKAETRDDMRRCANIEIIGDEFVVVVP